MTKPNSEPTWITVNVEWIPSSDVNAVYETAGDGRFTQDVVAVLTQHLYSGGIPVESRVVFGTINPDNGRVIPVEEDSSFKGIRTKDKKRKREDTPVEPKVYPTNYRD